MGEGSLFLSFLIMRNGFFDVRSRDLARGILKPAFPLRSLFSQLQADVPNHYANFRGSLSLRNPFLAKHSFGWAVCR